MLFATFMKRVVAFVFIKNTMLTVSLEHPPHVLSRFTV
jgi:hypothetical protein